MLREGKIKVEKDKYRMLREERIEKEANDRYRMGWKGKMEMEAKAIYRMRWKLKDGEGGMKGRIYVG